MTAQSLKSAPMTSKAILNVTSSQALLDGHTPSGLPGGRMTGHAGPAHAPVSRFRALESGKAMPTNDTSGPLFTASSPSAGLQLCLENRLQERTERNGCPLYGLILKPVDMPSGPAICRLKMSALCTKDSGFGGLLPVPTPTASDGNGSGILRRNRGAGNNLRDWFKIRFNFLYPPVVCSAWLMGYNQDHLNSAPTATRLSRR